MAEKMTGTYKCVICDTLWDKTEIHEHHGHLTCGDACCGANVRKVSDLPKGEYVASATKAKGV